MKKEKSKILKLKKKYNRTLWLEKNLFKIIAITIYSSIAAMCLAAILQILPLFIIGVSFFIASFGALSCNVGIQNLIFNRRSKIDDEIAELSNTDSLEKQILDEYNAIQDLKDNTKSEIKARNRIIKHMIEIKKQEEDKELEQKAIEIYEFYNKQDKDCNANITNGYSRTKATKVYAEKVNEVVKEENEKGLN